MIQLIADSGATNTEWRVLDGSSVKAIRTEGVSPVQIGPAKIKTIVSKVVLPVAGADVDRIWFYGAGVVGEMKDTMVEILQKVFPKAEVAVESDLLAACRALFGSSAGIACILGTGSNCCFWDGKAISASSHAGGFILGDEGSGAYMGKRLLADYVKDLVPNSLANEMYRRFNLSYEEIVRRVYHEEAPGRYLASFSPYIAERRNHPYMKNLISESLEEFIFRNIVRFDPRRYQVGFVGSVAEAYQDVILQKFRNAGFKLGPLCTSPIEGLVKYHSQQ